MALFDKILIANRGEIACRIIKTARRMGIGCVAVYSEADRRAPYVGMADEAIGIGPAAPAQSYLAIEKIIAAARASGAEAVHPGYGFLSENAAFAETVAAAGLTFIGPNARAIAAMGDKLAAKALAHASGVPVLPGSQRAIADLAEARLIVREIGYPLMLKPSAGGGGKGMRLIQQETELADAFASAQAQAAAAFGDGRVFLEKFIAQPRHIEIQILGDRFGDRVHLGERECSIQRRHQKIVEEAPSPFVDDDLRARMGEAALALAASVDYDSAGTVEFLVDPETRAFYFLEMNTRLQVEHPVTEYVTGLDLVEAMIEIAAGARLTLTQADVTFEGSAIESRIYAEDPARGFLPSAGRLVTFRPPQETGQPNAALRLDAGVVEGSSVTPDYDPLLAKLVTRAPSRAEAIAAQAEALDRFAIEGIADNLDLLADLMQQADFRIGALSTDFIARAYPCSFVPREASMEEWAHLAVVAVAIDHTLSMCHRAGAAPVAPSVRTVLAGEKRIDVEIVKVEAGLRLRVGATCFLCVPGWQPGQKIWTGTIDGRPVFMRIARRLYRVILHWHGLVVETAVLSPRQAALAAGLPQAVRAVETKLLRAPMPGLLKSLAVVEGQAVRQGEVLCVIEAMKMETVLHAADDGVVARIFILEGQSLAFDAPLLEFK